MEKKIYLLKAGMSAIGNHNTCTKIIGCYTDLKLANKARDYYIDNFTAQFSSSFGVTTYNIPVKYSIEVMVLDKDFEKASCHTKTRNLGEHMYERWTIKRKDT